jgi:uncharacterized protein (TIGR02117 family)
VENYVVNSKRQRGLSVAFLLTTLAGCFSPQKVALRPERPARPEVQHPFQLASYEQRVDEQRLESESRTIYVVGHGWHTGLVLPTRHVSSQWLPEIDDFGSSDFVEIGWGDEGFYRADKMSIPLIASAGFWPTKSVLHVAGFRGKVDEVFVVSDIVEIELSTEQFEQLCRFIGDTFDRGETGSPTSLGDGVYGRNSVFYRAQGKYYFPKTCNVWTAKALDEAGLSVMPTLAITAENVLSQSRRLGRVVRESERGIKSAALFGRGDK